MKRKSSKTNTALLNFIGTVTLALLLGNLSLANQSLVNHSSIDFSPNSLENQMDELSSTLQNCEIDRSNLNACESALDEMEDSQQIQKPGLVAGFFIFLSGLIVGQAVR